MRWKLTALLFAGVGLVAAAACSEDEGDGNGGTTTTPSGSTGGAAGQGGQGCGVDLVTPFGSTQECSECLNETCCPQAQAYEASPTRDTHDALWDCATQLCDDECRAPFCSNAASLPFMYACADCLNDRCCAPFAECIVNAACNDCLLWASFEQESCCADPLYAPWDNCVLTECADECILPYSTWGACGTGGAGGSGGGTGGNAGSGGS